MKHLITFTIYYGSFLAFPFLGWMIWKIFHKDKLKITIPLLILSLSFIWGRFIEPQMIVVRHEEGPTNFVLIADTHLGNYKGPHFLERVATKVNNLEPKFVLFPGDFVFSINPSEIEEYFAPLSKINAPIYATLGNHDMEPAGELKDNTLISTLENYGVTWIDNKSVIVDDIQLIGLGELWNDDVDISTLRHLKPDLVNIILAHNPDTAHLLKNIPVDLIVSGHTHGGQIRIPFLYKLVVPTEYDWGTAQGWSEALGNSVFITSGLGETALPMRLFNPPEIISFN